MIKFGSRAELILPPSVRLAVSVGDRVKGGETIIGEYQNDR
jgi:phosphatidylserine decarboxylase